MAGGRDNIPVPSLEACLLNVIHKVNIKLIHTIWCALWALPYDIKMRHSIILNQLRNNMKVGFLFSQYPNCGILLDFSLLLRQRIPAH